MATLNDKYGVSELRQGGNKSFAQGLEEYLNPEFAEPNTLRKFIGNAVSNAREMVGMDDESLARNQGLQSASQKLFDYTLGRKKGQTLSPEERADLEAKDKEYMLNIGSLSPAIGMLDHGILNTSLAKRGNIDNQIDKYLKDQNAIKQARAKEVGAKAKTEKQQAKELMLQIMPEDISALSARINKTTKEVKETIERLISSNPATAIKAMNGMISKRASVVDAISPEERAKNLAKFMEGSKVPEPVYQGRSKKDLTSLTNPRGESWFTNDILTAEKFAGLNESYYPYRLPEDGPNYEKTLNGEIYEANLSMKNPKTISIDETLWDMGKEAEQIKRAKSEGHDGLFIDHNNGKIDYVAFSPNQIKSATGNRGTYDPSDPNILHSLAPIGALGGLGAMYGVSESGSSN